jgi:hypothetical protein
MSDTKTPLKNWWGGNNFSKFKFPDHVPENNKNLKKGNVKLFFDQTKPVFFFVTN